MERRLSEFRGSVTMEWAQAALADWVASECMSDPDASWRDRLVASDQANRRLGRYKDQPVAQLNIQAFLSGGLDRPGLELDPLDDLSGPADVPVEEETTP